MSQIEASQEIQSREDFITSTKGSCGDQYVIASRLVPTAERNCGPAEGGAGVVTDKGADGAETLPAASNAETVKEYSVLAESPMIETNVPLGEATSVPSRYTL